MDLSIMNFKKILSERVDRCDGHEFLDPSFRPPIEFHPQILITKVSFYITDSLLTGIHVL